ncbi:hypothetical protein [uncultured Jannaschia sp.]|uniref:hypothetical protein n=1 Tax=uncultured Jannaschia sp. TaxID=293347 RepID=UPI00262BC65A|nr:hypothetical protein [uncultured Jannaschia sp.]
MDGRVRIGAAALALAATLAGCGGTERTSPSPMRILDSPRDAAMREALAAGAPNVERIVSLSAAPTPSGLIVSAVGLPPTQGYWEAELVDAPRADPATLVLDFKLLAPLEPEPVGTQRSREVLAGRYFSRQDLTGISGIVVRGATDSRRITRQ